MAVCQNLVPLVNIKIAGKWMFIPLKMVLIDIDPYPYIYTYISNYEDVTNENFGISFWKELADPHGFPISAGTP